MTQPRRPQRPAEGLQVRELPPIDLSGLPEELKDKADDPATVLLVRNAQLQATLAERDDLKAKLESTQGETQTLRQTLVEREAELGKLRAVAEQLDGVVKERDELRSRLAEVEASVDERVRDAVKAALDTATAEHQATIQKLESERDALAKQVEDLRKQLEATGVTGQVRPTDLAGHFASVLDELAAPVPQPGRPFSAALTSLEVEARGVLEAPREGEEEPMLRTAESGVDPGQLSTLRMSFRLLPHAAEVPPPEG